MIGSPLFIVSNPKLVIAQCRAGIVGAFPALNARGAQKENVLDDWLTEIKSSLPEGTPFAVNQIVHRSNPRLEHDMDVISKHKVPIVITSLGARTEINDAVHSYGGIVLHDVINQTFAKKAIDKGADGLILVAHGAGGHAGRLSPFALVAETRQWFPDGIVCLAGAIGTGRGVAAAVAAGATYAYVGSPFIATEEASASDAYKQAIVDSAASDCVYTNLPTGVHGNYLRASFINAGMDPDNLPESDPSQMNFGGTDTKAWRDIWGCGQGIGNIDAVLPTSALVDRFHTEFLQASEDLASVVRGCQDV